MADSKSAFEPLKLGVAAFVLLIFAVVFAALLVDGLVRDAQKPSAEETARNIAPVGRVYIRPAE